jgi:anaerobic selenocysteine-containing dehydrogenase
MTHDPKFTSSTHPAGGWGSVQSLGRSLAREHVPFSGSRILMHQNKPDGFACVSCAWAKPGEPHLFEFCEEGAKATTWEVTGRCCTPAFFANHVVAALRSWSDHDLEEEGPTQPLRWDAASDRYLAVDWNEAISAIGRELKTFDAKRVVFYSSGRASLEASYTGARAP